MFFVRSKKNIIIAVSILVVVVVGVVVFKNIRGAKTVATNTVTTTKATKGNIKVEISGSGVIEPIQSYDISSLVSGKIDSAPFEEGDKVKKDDILYKLDATELEGNIQKTMNSISRLELNAKDTQDNIGKTVIYAGTSGRLTNFNVKENDSITSNKLGDIVDDSYCLAKVPFNEAQIKQISVGQQATVNSAALMSSIQGTVTKISSFSSKTATGAVLYEVEIKINGNNSLIKDTEVTAQIGGLESPEAGKIYSPETYSVASSLAGRVKKVYASNNDYVGEGQRLLELENDTYTSTLNKSSLDRSDLTITLGTQQKQLENYNIKSPIDGIVLQKNKKAEDTITAGVNVQALMVVADMSKVKFDMKIDELDINKIKIGQSVTVTADALPDKQFTGQITSIAGKGTAANGVSNYLVEVTINEPGALKPGMNVNAKTVVAEKSDITIVPASAVWKKDGKSYVTLHAGSTGKSSDVNVELGINNKDFIEIAKGLNVGDEIVIPTVKDDSKNNSKANARVQPGGNQQQQGGMAAIPK